MKTTNVRAVPCPYCKEPMHVALQTTTRLGPALLGRVLARTRATAIRVSHVCPDLRVESDDQEEQILALLDHVRENNVSVEVGGVKIQACDSEGRTVPEKRMARHLERMGRLDQSNEHLEAANRALHQERDDLLRDLEEARANAERYRQAAGTDTGTLGEWEAQATGEREARLPQTVVDLDALPDVEPGFSD